MQRDRDCCAYVIDMYRSKRALYTGKRGLGMVYCVPYIVYGVEDANRGCLGTNDTQYTVYCVWCIVYRLSLGILYWHPLLSIVCPLVSIV